MENRTQIDETVKLETLHEVQSYCNDHDLTLDEFLREAIRVMAGQSEKR